VGAAQRVAKPQEIARMDIRTGSEGKPLHHLKHRANV